MADRSVPVDDGCVQVGQELVNIDAVNLGPDLDIVVTGPGATETRYAVPGKNRDGFWVGLDDVLDLHLLIDPHPSPLLMTPHHPRCSVILKVNPVDGARQEIFWLSKLSCRA